MAGDRPVMGRWFEDLTPELVIDHAVTRTVTEADNTLFSVSETTHGTTPANLGFEETAFPAPVFHG